MKKLFFQNIKVAFSLFIIIFLIRLLFLFKDFSLDTVIQAAINSGITTIVVTTIMVLYQIFYIRSNKISFKDFDIQPTQSSTFIVDQTFEEAKNIIENIIPKTINSNKFKYELEQELFITKTNLSIYSWGETIRIKLIQLENTKTKISILSKPVLMTTLFDLGKSSINIHKIKLAFDKNGL